MNHTRLWLALIFISIPGLSTADSPNFMNKYFAWSDRQKSLDFEAVTQVLNTILPTSPSQHPLEEKIKTKAKAALTSLLITPTRNSHHDLDYVAKTRADMHGALPEIMEDLIAHLKEPKKYPCQKAVMFYGPPGTGKTLGAQVVAGEAGAIIYHVNASEIINKYVGVGASNLRDIFSQAEKDVKDGHRVVIFFDEIDALCNSRNDENMNGEQRQTLNELLALMTYVHNMYKDRSIVLVGATNFKDLLDSALLRPGRFGAPVEIGLPNKENRRSILEKKGLAAGVNIPEKLLDNLASKTHDFNNAELENIIFVAQTRARKNGKDVFSVSDINAIFPEELKKQRERLKHEQEQEHRKKAREYMLDEQLKRTEIEKSSRIMDLVTTIGGLAVTTYKHLDKIQGPLRVIGELILKAGGRIDIDLPPPE